MTIKVKPKALNMQRNLFRFCEMNSILKYGIKVCNQDAQHRI